MGVLGRQWQGEGAWQTYQHRGGEWVVDGSARDPTRPLPALQLAPDGAGAAAAAAAAGGRLDGGGGALAPAAGGGALLGGGPLCGELGGEVRYARLGLDLVIHLWEGVDAVVPLARLVEEREVEHLAQLGRRAKDVGVERLPASDLARPVLHRADVLLCVPDRALAHGTRDAVGSEVDPQPGGLALLDLGRAGGEQAGRAARLRRVVEDAHREDEERVGAEPVVELCDAFREAPQRHDALLHDVRVDGGSADDGPLRQLEERDLGRAEPAPEGAVERVVGEGDHVLELPKDGPREAVQKVLERDRLLEGAGAEGRLDVPVVERLVPDVDAVQRRGSRGARVEVARLDDGVVAVVQRRLEEVGRLSLAEGSEPLQLRGELCSGRGGEVLDADVRLRAEKLHLEASQEADGAVRPRQRVEELGLVLGHRVAAAVRVDKLVLEHRLLEEADLVRVCLDTEAHRQPADCD
mmetsp:Transcript_45022/g.144884  ORF Transcript_45022/g.144884 Transcript_45022/m.144884 type:complete len:466 (+) Transcript_45022:180-1577(+)